MGNRVAERGLTLYRDRMVTEKRCCAGFIDFTGSNAHRKTVEQSVICGQCIAVDEQKGHGCNNRGALVSIHESMVAAYSEDIGGCDFGMVRLAIGQLVLRTRQGRLKGVLIPKPLSSAMALQLLDMDGFNNAT